MARQGERYFFKPGTDKVVEIRVKKGDIEIYEIPSGMREKLSRLRIVRYWREKSEKFFDILIGTTAILLLGGFIFFLVWIAKNIQSETLKVILLGTPIGWMGLGLMLMIGLVFILLIFLSIDWVLGEKRIGLIPNELQKFVAKFSEKRGTMTIIGADILLAGWLLYQKDTKTFWEIAEKAQDGKEFLILTGIIK